MKTVTNEEFLAIARGKMTQKQEKRVKENGYRDYIVMSKGETVIAKEGRSYFGSGGYFAYVTINGESDRKLVKSEDNGFYRADVIKVTPEIGTVVSHEETDDIDGGRTFASFIAICM